MLVLVTGGAGFIGSHLSKRLLEKNYKIVIVDNLITGNKKNLDTLADYKNWKFINANVEDFETKLAFDEIYHFACPTGVPNCQRLGIEMLTACSDGTKNILGIAIKSKAKFLLASSSEVYGDAQVYPQDENYFGNVNTIGFRSSYEEGKRFAETLVSIYAQKNKLDAKIVRIFNTYGPNMANDDTRVIPRFITQVKNNQPLTVHGNGNQKRTFCYVDDLVDGLLLVMNKGKRGEIYNLGSDQEIAILDLAKMLISTSNSKSQMKFISRPKHDHNRRLPDLKKIEALGWKAKIPLKLGLKKTLEEIKN